ncbi:hypothetical protein Q5530_07130 [Saccharothrix sp. BKS2]|uniref:hypothetical protein n=1 Tax=Saccharothrix sp. BKS2 TaxID=3064400 RepID=UPI0039E75E7C
MTGSRLWRYEARRVGVPALLVSPVFAVVLLLLRLGLLPEGYVGGWLVQAVPALVAGMAATAAAVERSAELQLTMPTPFRTTISRRLVLVGATAVLSSLALIAWLTAAGVVRAPVTEYLLVCSFATMLAAVGCWSTLALRSVAGASAVVLAAWLGTLLVLDRVVTPPLARSIVLLVLAAVLFTNVLRLSADGEDLIGAGE